MEKARGAEELLGACLAALSDDAGSVGARERLGLLPDNGHDDRKRDAQAVHAALLQVGVFGCGRRLTALLDAHALFCTRAIMEVCHHFRMRHHSGGA